MTDKQKQELKAELDIWNEVKYGLNLKTKMPTIREGMVWWCAFGKNVGVEIEGKSKVFSRPVLILKKLSKNFIWGIPLTSQQKTGTWYVPLVFKGKQQYAVVAQPKSIDTKRLMGYMGMVEIGDYMRVLNGVKKLLLNNIPTF